MIDRLYEIVAKNIELDLDSVSEETSAFDIAGWDSVKHMNLVSDLEQEYGVRFEDNELPALTVVSAIRNSLERHGVLIQTE
ncbi:MAG: acyl carrier protein [Verrucomicrobiales bacterium]|nr:acyl carrier protein [Verrucomicrobiales bacterium]